MDTNKPEIFMNFLSPSRQIPEECLILTTTALFHMFSNESFTNHRNIQRVLQYDPLAASLNKQQIIKYHERFFLKHHAMTS
jgi:hypothetical protein